MDRPERWRESTVISQSEGQAGYNIAFDKWEAYHKQEMDKIKQSASVEKILEIVILGALETKINKKVSKAFVFICCGKPRKKIENRGLCPHCLKENTEVVNLWKFNLAKAIHKLIGK